MESSKIIRETLFYVQQFKNSIFVIYLEDKIICRIEELGILRDIYSLQDIGIKIVIFYSNSKLEDRIYQLEFFHNIAKIEIALKSKLIPAMYCDNNSSTEKMICDASIQLCAKKIIFVTNYNGIYDKNRQLIAEMTIQEAEKLLDKKIITGKARRIIEAAIIACKTCKNMLRVHIVNGGKNGSLLKEIFLCEGTGTMLYASSYQEMREANKNDIQDIIIILQNSKFWRSLNINYSEIIKNIKKFLVYAVDQQVYGCCMITDDNELSVIQIDYLAVLQEYENSNILKAMLEYILKNHNHAKQYIAMAKEKNLIWLGMYPWFIKELAFKKNNDTWIKKL